MKMACVSEAEVIAYVAKHLTLIWNADEQMKAAKALVAATGDKRYSDGPSFERLAEPYRVCGYGCGSSGNTGVSYCEVAISVRRTGRLVLKITRFTPGDIEVETY